MTDTTPEIDIETFANATPGDATIVDVRELSEYVEGHVPGAVPIPMGQIPRRLDALDKSRPVYVICASGNRSAAITDLLVGAGYSAYSVSGGTAAWARSGRPLEPGRAS